MKNNFMSLRLAMRQEDAEVLASNSLKFFQNKEGYTTAKKESGELNLVNHVERREDGIAVIKIDGALKYRGDSLAYYLGVDSYDSIEAAFDSVLADDDVKGIVFDINSPGGEINGCGDLADKIYNARGSKPCGIVARTGGTMSSAAYWIGSSCEKVYSAANASLGSIGVMCRLAKSDDDSVDIVVSDLSPDKNLPVDSAKGMKAVKKELNSMAEVFIAAVARNRGVSPATVKSDFGKGGMFIGTEAVEAGLADGVIGKDELYEKMLNGTLKQEGAMPQEKTAQAANVQPTAEEIGKNAVAAYKQSIADVKSVFEGCGLAEDAVAFVDSGKTVAEAREFAFSAMQKKIKSMVGEHAEAIAAKDSEIAQLKTERDEFKAKAEAAPAADANLSEAQKLAIQKGLEAEAAAANSVQGGIRASENTDTNKIRALLAQGRH